MFSSQYLLPFTLDVLFEISLRILTGSCCLFTVDFTPRIAVKEQNKAVFLHTRCLVKISVIFFLVLCRLVVAYVASVNETKKYKNNEQ